MNTHKSLRMICLASASSLVMVPALAQAQTPVFPTHAISLLVPFGPGGIADLTARAVAQAMSAFA